MSEGFSREMTRQELIKMANDLRQERDVLAAKLAEEQGNPVKCCGKDSDCQDAFRRAEAAEANLALERSQHAGTKASRQILEDKLAKAELFFGKYKNAREVNTEMKRLGDALAASEESRRRLREALSLWVENFERDIASDNFLGDDEHEAMRVTEKALAEESR